MNKTIVARILINSQEIADLIGLNVEFKFKGKGGEIRIGFSQFDELDSLFKKLGIEAA